MRERLSPPPVSDSPLGRLDPRWRLAGLLLLAVSAAVARTLPGLALAFAAAVALAVLGRLPWRWARGRLLGTFALLALFALPPALLSPDGVRLALLVTGKGVTVTLLGLVLLTTAPVEVTLKAAGALRLPSLLVVLTLMSYRYLFLLADELTRLRVALRARGFRNAASLHGYRTVGNLAGVLLVRGSERAERVGQAMRCRGFEGRFRSLADFRTTRRDVLAFGLLALLAGAVTWLGGFPG